MADAVFRFVSRICKLTPVTRLRRIHATIKAVVENWRSKNMVGRRLSQQAADVHNIANKCSAQQVPASAAKRARGYESYKRGLAAEEAVCQRLRAAGWSILLQRAKTRRGEIDIVAQNGATICFVEVKQRQTLRGAAECLSVTQSRRLYRAAECLLQSHPCWQYENLRFDLFMLDAQGQMEWLEDIIRQM
jgi:putative endonuclease